MTDSMNDPTVRGAPGFGASQGQSASESRRETSTGPTATDNAFSTGTGSASGERSYSSTSGNSDAESLTRRGRKLAEPVLGMARDMADDQKAAGVEQIGVVARAVHKAASSMEGDSPRTAALIHEAASGLEQASSALRERSIDDLAHSIGRFARNQPAAFFGGSLAAGFALARFFKSSAAQSSAAQSSAYAPSSSAYAPSSGANPGYGPASNRSGGGLP